MPKYAKGNIFDSNADYKLITTNGCITKDGRLVMGRGAALEATKRYPRIAYAAAEVIKDSCLISNDDGIYVYNVLYIKRGIDVGLFQVKYHWRDTADIDLIRGSTLKLNLISRKYKQFTYALNYPGIGNGKLNKELVAPILDILPDNVTIYEL